MRARLILLALTASLATPAGAAPVPPVSSDNLTLVGNIPEVSAVGGHVRTVDTASGPKRYLMMTGLDGVSTYDVTVPETPILAGTLPLPHISNEDVEVGGDLMLVSVDPQWVDICCGGGVLGGIYVLDISALPLITFAYTAPLWGNRWIGAADNYAGHTVTCVRTDCSYAIVNGVEEVVVIDLRVPSAPKVVTRFDSPAGADGPSTDGTHDAQMDASGIVWISGSGGVAGYDFADPARPRVVAPATKGGLTYQHNSWRPRASEWVPRAPGDTASAVRPGELMLVTEEEFYPPGQQFQCNGQGRFQTRRIRDTDALTSGATPVVEVLDTWETELNLGSMSTSTLCSAHYFHEREGIVAMAWYQQGLRFLDVSDPRDIRQVGYYMPPTADVWSAEWIGLDATGAEILYSIDNTSGLDILRFDREPGAPTVRAPAPPVDASRADVRAQPHPRWGYACRLG